MAAVGSAAAAEPRPGRGAWRTRRTWARADGQAAAEPADGEGAVAMGATVTPSHARRPGQAPVVSLRDVSKAYGPIQALDGRHARAARRRGHCLAGENGAGKSTLIKILTGAIRRDSGEYLIDGQRRRQPAARPRRATAGIGVVYQELSLLPDLSVGGEPADGPPARRAAAITRPAELRTPGARDARARRPGLARPEHRGRRRSRWPSASSSRSPRCSARTRACSIFDEPTTALSESETKALLARIHAAARRGPRDHVRHPPPRGDVRDRRPRDGPARRRPRHERADEPSSTRTA